MKTTVDLPDQLLAEAKKAAIERRTTLRELIARGLRREIQAGTNESTAKTPIRWVTVPGGLPEGLDVRDRTDMINWLSHDRD